jgi:hypothetical protein
MNLISLKHSNMMPTENQISSFRIFYFALPSTPLPEWPHYVPHVSCTLHLSTTHWISLSSLLAYHPHSLFPTFITDIYIIHYMYKQWLFFLDWGPWRWRHCSCVSVRTAHLTWHHIPDLQTQQPCQVLKSHRVLLVYYYIFSAVTYTVTHFRVTMPTTI